MDAQQLIEKFVQVRDKRAEIKQEYEAKDEKYRAAQEMIKRELLKHMESVNSTQLKGDAGTAYRNLVRRFGAADWNQVWGFIKENDRFDMLEKRLGQKAMADYLDETGEMPPGVNLHQEYDVTIRRS